MKRYTLTAFCILMCTLAGAQTFGGLEFGTSYQEDRIFEALGTPVSSETLNSSVTYSYGESSYTFDNGRFVDARIKGEGSVGLPGGTLAIGDDLSKLIAMRVDLAFVDYPEGMCRLQYPNGEGRMVQFIVKYDADRKITSMNSFSTVAPKERIASTGAHFYESMRSIETSCISICAGDSLEEVLSFRVDVEFSPYGNGVCRIVNSKRHEQYLLRYDLDRKVREILPVFDDTPQNDGRKLINLPKYTKY